MSPHVRRAVEATPAPPPSPPEPAPPPKRRLTIDEILDEVSSLAQDPNAGADRFRALKMLATTESAAVVLPEPRADGEVVDRLARVMRGAGAALTQVAYKRAFPSRRDATFVGGKARYVDATPEMYDRARSITSIKLLNLRYPEGKVNNIPIGYPVKGSIAAKKKWCQEQALRMEVERERQTREQAHAELTAGHDAIVKEAEQADVPVDPEDLS